MTYNAEGKRIRSENLAGQVTTTAWDCCHKVSETGPAGSTTTWDYDDEGRMIASSRLIPLDMTNVTWLTTCYEYDDLGRKIYEGGATYPVRYTYDIFGNKTTMTTYRDETSRTGGSPVQDEGTFSWSYLPGSDLKSSLSYTNLYNGMIQKCDKIPNLFFKEKARCYAMAKTFYFAVDKLGDGPFESAQDDACEWECCGMINYGWPDLINAYPEF